MAKKRRDKIENDLINELEKRIKQIDTQLIESTRKNVRILTESYEKITKGLESSFSKTLNSFSHGTQSNYNNLNNKQDFAKNQLKKRDLLIDSMTVSSAVFENVTVKGQTSDSTASSFGLSSKGAEEESKKRLRSIENLLSESYTDVGLGGATESISKLIGIRQNVGLQNNEQVQKLSATMQIGLKAANIFEDAAKSFINIGFKRFEKAVTQFESIYQKEYNSIAAFTGRDQQGYRELQTSISEWTRENYRGSLSSAAIIEDFSKNVQKGFSEQFSISKAQQDAIINQVNPALNTQSAQFTSLQRLLGQGFSTQMAGMLEAVTSTAGSSIALVEHGNKMLEEMAPIAYNARNNRFAQENADIFAKLSAAVESNHMSQSQMDETIRQLTLMNDPVTGMRSGNLATKMALANPSTDLGSIESLANAYIESSASIVGMLGTGTSNRERWGRSSAANVMGFDGAWMTHNPEGYDLRGFSNVFAGNLEQYGAKVEKDVASDKYVTELEKQNNWWQNSMSADVVSKFAERFPDAYEVFNATTGPALKEIQNLIKTFLVTNAVTSLSGGGGLLGGAGGLTKFGGKLFNTAKFSAARSSGSSLLSSAGSGLTNIGRVVGGSAGILAGGAMMYDDYKNYSGTYDSGGSWKSVLWGDNTSGSDFNMENAGSQALKFGRFGAGIGSLIAPGVGTAVGALIGGAAGFAAEGIRKLTASVEENRKEVEYSQTSWGRLEQALDSAKSGVERTTDPFVKFAQESKRGYSLTDMFGKTIDVDGSYKDGLSNVPYDEYMAKLHEGESVSTKEATEVLRRVNNRFWTKQGAQEIAENIDLVSAIREQTDQLTKAYTYNPDSLENQLKNKIRVNQIERQNLSEIGV